MTQPERAEGEVSGSEELEADWSSASTVPVAIANVFVAQGGASSQAGRADGVYLTAGHVAPPMFVGSADSVRRTLRSLNGKIPVEVAARLFIPRDRVEELVKLLSETLQKIDEQEGRSV